MSEFNMDDTVEKLIILFIFDKMEIPLQESTVLELSSRGERPYVPYMMGKQLVRFLLDVGFIYECSKAGGNVLYAITNDGRACITHYYTKIPSSIREEISADIKRNRLDYRKKQEYVADYFKNKDGTHTVVLKIFSPMQPIMELKLVVGKRLTAKWIYENWSDKASQVYELINELLID